MHFLAQARKNRKIRPQKNSLYFRKWNFVRQILQIFQETEIPKNIPYISGNGKRKNASYISRNGTFQSTSRKFLIFQETETLKKFLIFFQKKAVLLFQETEVSYISGNPIKNFPRSKSKNKTSYISKDNLQSLKIKNFLYFSL